MVGARRGERRRAPAGFAQALTEQLVYATADEKVETVCPERDCSLEISAVPGILADFGIGAFISEVGQLLQEKGIEPRDPDEQAQRKHHRRQEKT